MRTRRLVVLLLLLMLLVGFALVRRPEASPGRFATAVDRVVREWHRWIR